MAYITIFINKRQRVFRSDLIHQKRSFIDDKVINIQLKKQVIYPTSLISKCFSRALKKDRGFPLLVI